MEPVVPWANLICTGRTFLISSLDGTAPAFFGMTRISNVKTSRELVGILGSLLGLSGRDLYLCLQEVLGLFLKGERTALDQVSAG